MKTIKAIIFSFIFPIFLSSFVSIAIAEELSGYVVGVLDGDTVTLLDDGKVQHRIRLAQIDAPEIGHGKNRPGQPFGMASKQSLSKIAYGRKVVADCKTKDRYGRKVCTLWLGKTNINLLQVQYGMAWVYRKYAKDLSYFQGELDAKKAKIGLWADANPVPPWKYRR